MIITKKFNAKGMYCASCEQIIEETAMDLKGVEKIKMDYPTETGQVTFDSKKMTLKKIFAAIDKQGYHCSLIEKKTKEDKKQKVKQDDSEYFTFNVKWIGIAFAIIGLLVGGYFLLSFFEGIAIPEINANMSYGLLFVVGLLTGFHCIGMCGGFVVSYTTKDAEAGRKPHRSHLMYGLGKTISYIVIGAMFGLLGTIIAFTPMMRGVAGILAGLFLVLFGLNMLNVSPWLRKIRIKTPAVLTKFIGKESRKHKSPLAIGLLNGLMIACGPLQAMYIMAAGTGSMIEGAKLMLIFGLGTLPVMLGFGFVTSFISTKATHKILKFSGAVVIVLGLIMMNRGLALTGTGFDTNTLITSVSASKDVQLAGNSVEMQDGYQIINMEVNRYGWEPDKFVLKKDVPVRWIINGKEINGCNNAIQVPKYGLNFDIKPGEQIIEFTPTKEGVVSWSCWMGMIPGVFVVRDDIDLGNSAEVQKELDAVPDQPRGSCGGNCGTPGCGAKTGGGCGCGR